MVLKLFNILFNILYAIYFMLADPRVQGLIVILTCMHFHGSSPRYANIP